MIQMGQKRVEKTRGGKGIAPVKTITVFNFTCFMYLKNSTVRRRK